LGSKKKHNFRRKAAQSCFGSGFAGLGLTGYKHIAD
jgi:hypothetical protein